MISQPQQSDNPAVPYRSRRVLVAEDSPVTLDLLKLILSQRGHSVDLAEDGELALSALQRNNYDVALIDFHLPKLNGLEVVQQYRSKANGDLQTQLIAITADVEGLLSDKENCENFDQIIAKPLDVYNICNVIERSGGGDDGDEDALAPTGVTSPAPRGNTFSRRIVEPSWALGLELLRWPQDFESDRLSPGTLQSFENLDAIDAILVLAPATASDLTQIWQQAPLHLYPIIDLEGSLGHSADLSVSLASVDSINAVSKLIQSFNRQRSQLHRDFMSTSELGEKLLSRLFVMNAGLEPRCCAEEKTLVQYNLALNTEKTIQEAELQTRDSLLERKFFDRFHVCTQCFSSRLHIREECPKCRSAQLQEESYIHHFRCGHLGAESKFRQGAKLVCPKCRQDLVHFSVDYDKPGTAVVCLSCGNTGSEPAVGFRCLDCSSHFDGDQASTKDIFSYRLTETCEAFLKMGYAFRGAAQKKMRFTDLPLEFVVVLNAAARRFNETETPFSVANLIYENEREIIREAGARQFSQARGLFLENLKGGIGETGLVVKGHAHDFCLLHGMQPDAAGQHIQPLVKRAAENLSVDPGVRVHVIGPADFV